MRPLDNILDYLDAHIRVSAAALIVFSPVVFLGLAAGYLWQCSKTLITGKI